MEISFQGRSGGEKVPSMVRFLAHTISFPVTHFYVAKSFLKVNQHSIELFFEVQIEPKMDVASMQSLNVNDVFGSRD